MKRLWNYIDKKDWNAEAKFHVVTLILSITSALVGFAFWQIIKPWALSTIDWMICFTCYPVFFSWVAAFYYYCSHDFHDGKSAD